MKSRIRAIATGLPTRIVTNNDFQAENPDWDMAAIELRAGVQRRHIAASDETAFDLAKVACDKLKAGDLLDGVDAIIFCTQTPDYIMPQNAHLLHDYLALPDAVAAFDINLACSGYVYGLSLAHALIGAGNASRVLLATADTYSKLIHPRDRSARVLFGDGAAVSIIEADSSDNGMSRFSLASHGKGHNKFRVPAGGHRLPRSDDTKQETADRNGNVRTLEHIHMDGLAVWSFINSAAPVQIRSFVEQQGFALGDTDHFIFHQASKLTLDSLVKCLGIDPNRVHRNLATVGNLVSASIPVCLADAISGGRLQIGDRVLLSGFGVGLSYATTSFVFDGEIDVY